jgi:hypothetical protein
MDLNDLHLPPEQHKELQKLLDQAHRNYRDDLDNLTDAATDAMETALSQDDLDIKELVQEYTRDASQLADDYYTQTRALWEEYSGQPFPDVETNYPIDPDRVLWQVQGGFSNTDYNGLTYQQVKEGRSRAGATIDDLWPDMKNVDDAQQFIAEMIQASTRLTAMRNMRMDPTNPRWARVPKGAVTCAFCLMLASRGFAYLSEESAGLHNLFHPDCDCAIVPSWGKQTLAGYDPGKYLDMWNKAKPGDGDYKQALQRLRRLYPEETKDGLYELSKPWPDDVIQPRKTNWNHIMENHGPGTRVNNKTHFPDEWSEKRVQYAVKEAVANPDYESAAKDGARDYRYLDIDGQIIRVWLQKKRSTHGRYAVHTAYPLTEQERGRIWQQMRKRQQHTAD